MSLRKALAALLKIALFACSHQAPTPAADCFPAPNAVLVDADPRLTCARGGGFWTRFSSTCSDCESMAYGICGQMITEGCGCDRGGCFNGVACVPASCMDHYRSRAPQVVVREAERQRLQRKVDQQSDEPSRALALRDWLRTEHLQHQVDVMTNAGLTLELVELSSYKADDLKASIIIRTDGASFGFDWSPKNIRSVQVLGAR